MTTIYGLVTDCKAVTNERAVRLSEAARLIAQWGINEILEPNIIAGAASRKEVVRRLAQRYRPALLDSAQFKLQARAFEDNVASEVRVDTQARRCLPALWADYSLAVLLTPREAHSLKRQAGFSRKWICIDLPDGIDGVMTEFEDSYDGFSCPHVWLGVFGSPERTRAAKKAGVTEIVGHVNGQGPVEEELLRKAGATHIASDWCGVLEHMVKQLDCRLPEAAQQLLPRGPFDGEPEYLSLERGPPSSINNPLESYFKKDRFLSKEAAPWLYPPYDNPYLNHRRGPCPTKDAY